jgi:acetoin utilization deacetylase AcuC-like enzyme
LPPGHRFPAQKYARLAARLRELGWRVDEAPAAPQEDLRRVHTAAYLSALESLALPPKAERRLGLPLSSALLTRERHTVGGTVAALYDARSRGYGVNLGGGTHHAFAGRSEGFCVFNDLAVTTYHALERGLASRVMIIDLDVHQGDGTAHLCAFDPHVLTYSVHGAHNYPFRKERSSCDVPLEDGVTDEVYLERLEATLPPALAGFDPDLALYVGGTDVLAGDRFGRAALSLAGVEARDRLVYGLLRAAGVPVVYTMGGGYHRDLGVTVEGHVRGVEALREIFA